VPLLDADIALKPVIAKKIEPLRIALVLGIAAVGLAIGLFFLLAPKQAKKTVREVVQAAQALVKKDPTVAKAEEQEEDESPPATFRKHRPRRGVVAVGGAPARSKLSPVHPVAPQPDAPRNPDLPLGTARRKVRELLGEPDLALYMLEMNHEVEHFVYVNRAQSSATSVLLVDGKVALVYSGMPSVWTGARAVRAGMESPIQN
jgi:hypothetical protein